MKLKAVDRNNKSKIIENNNVKDLYELVCAIRQKYGSNAVTDCFYEQGFIILSNGGIVEDIEVANHYRQVKKFISNY